MIGLCVLLAVGGGVLAVKKTRKTYSATATLLFQNPLITEEIFGNFATNSSIDPTTAQANDVNLASQPEIAQATAQRLGSTSPSTVTSDVSVDAAGASDLVAITATAHSARFAARLANAYAEATVAFQIEVQRAQITEAAKQLAAEIKSVSADQATTSTLKNRLAQLDAISALQTGNVQITALATPPGGPAGPSRTKDLTLALIAGLLVGLGAVVALERGGVTMKDQSEISLVLDSPIVGAIPESKNIDAGGAVDRLGPLIDGFRLLVMQLTYFNSDKQMRSFIVTSPGVGDGKSTVAWGMATAAAQIHPEAPVLLLDADLRRPRVAGIAGVSPEPGLTELILTGADGLEDAIRRGADSGGTRGFDVLPAGTEVFNPSELLASPAFRHVLKQLEQRYSLVVVDAPPTTVVPDAIPVMKQVSGVVVVARVGVTRRGALRHLAAQLRELDVPVLGVVANSVPRRTQSGYSGYYDYGASRV